MKAGAGKVDHSALRANQASIIALLILGFIMDSPPLVTFVAGVMLLGSLIGRPGFLPVYESVRALGIARPLLLADNAAPHRFAQTLGGVFLVLSTAGFFAGLPGLGWLLSWLVVALAALNLFVGFCVGCAVYYWFNRLGLPGFSQAPPAGGLPGMRPKESADNG